MKSGQADSHAGHPLLRLPSVDPHPRRVAVNRVGVVYWLLADPLHSTGLVLNAEGSLHSQARYYPYGEARRTAGTFPTDYRYTGQRREEALGLYHMGARFYPSLRSGQATPRWGGGSRRIRWCRSRGSRRR